jgi:MoaA/NifB/PqqE/SkfB family radical SAM enzyme
MTDNMKSICAKKPEMILLELTSKCNLNCDYCFKARAKIPSIEMEMDTFLKIQKNIAGIKNVLLCGMGEQFLHKEIYNFIRLLEDKRVYILTNGTIPIDFQRLLKCGNVNTLIFSIDGPNEEIMKKSCVRYDYNALIKNLDSGNKYKDITKSANYVLGPDNLEYTPDMLDFLQTFGFHSITLLLPTYNMKWITKNLEKIKTVVARSEEKSLETGVKAITPFSPKCTFNGAPVASIDNQGKLRACCDPTLRSNFMADVCIESLDTLWEHPEYKRFRTGIYCEKCIYNSPVFKNKKSTGA